jgi:type I restriction enzyme S subunit
MNKVKLELISKSISSGLTPLRSNTAYWDYPTIPWLKTDQLGEKYIYDTNEKISTFALEDTTIKINPINCLSIAMYGEGKTRGNVSILKREMTTNQACCNVVIDENQADPEYIYYFLKTQYHQLRTLSSGVRKNLNSNDIKNFEVTIPQSLLTQKKIAAVLSALDAKIEVNNRINAELENLAKTIYDYWFVQFDFPNEDGKPYKASGGEMVYHPELKREIPAGWEIKELGKVLTIVRGASPRPIDDFLSEKGLPWIKISDATASDNRFITETKQFIIKEGISKTRHIQPNTLILSNSATPGLPRIVKIEAGIHDGWLIILNYTNGLNQEFMYHYFLFEYSRIICLGNGSIFKNLKTDYVKDLKIVLPPQDILNQASKKFKFISELIYNQTQENQQLTQLRNWLLPLLMNGQITVE